MFLQLFDGKFVITMKLVKWVTKMEKNIKLQKRTMILFFAIMIVFSSISGGVYAAFQPSQVSTLAGTGELGSLNGKVQNAKFSFPSYAVQTKEGSMIISDTQNHLIRKVSNGNVETLAGVTEEVDAYGFPVGGFKDGNQNQAMFNEPKGLAVDAEGTIYIADSGNNAIRKMTTDGTVETVTDQLNGPTDIVISQTGTLYVTDTLNHQVVEVDQDGNVRTVAGGGYTSDGDWLIGDFADGNGLAAQFNEPTGLAIDAEYNLYVSDKGNQRIRKVTEGGEVTTVAGSGENTIEGTSYIEGGYIDGVASQAKFNYPNGLTIDEEGVLYIADTYNHVIRKLENNQVSTVAGNGDSGITSGTESNAQFSGPEDITVLNNNNLVVVDRLNNRLRIINWYELPVENEVNSDVTVAYNDEYILFPDEQPKIVNSRTMVPLRALSEFFNYEVVWESETETVYLSRDDQVITLQIGNTEVDLNGELFTLDAEPFIQGDRTHVPVRFISEAFDYQVDWLSKERAVLLRD